MNFDLLIDRRKHNADKWLLEDCDMLSFSVADMDFGCLEDIQQELKGQLITRYTAIPIEEMNTIKRLSTGITDIIM